MQHNEPSPSAAESGSGPPAVYRVEVFPRPGQPADPGPLETARQLGIAGLTACRGGRLYFLQGRLSAADADELARDLLADPVTEIYSLGAVHTDADHTIELTLLPGVTDPAAENLVRAARLLGSAGLERAAAGQRFLLSGALASADLRRLAVEVFSNPVIQRYSLDSPIAPPFVPFQPADDTVEVIALRQADDDALLALSAERRLSLDLAEMQAVRACFQAEGRDPTDAELEMLAQTWSEHCVHKTFKALIDYTGPEGSVTVDGLLKTYIRAATERVNRPWVRSAFVDNAGIIAFDEQYDLAFKVETHNRPSAIEPFGGANTGVGGVIRDVLGVSARPIANTDVLCFGPPDLPHEALQPGVLHPLRVAAGVAAGVEDYGNKMGIPTVNGAVLYHPGYTANPLVFCGCLGILPRGSHRTGARPGDLIVVVGGRTGRDGLRGATFSSMELDQTTGTVSGGAVQIGHPIHEKQAQEAVLRARDEGLYSAITDCGAGGLSSAVGEMGQDVGARVQLADVPLKYPGLRPWEIWLSEAQERMVLAVPPANWPRVQAICAGQDIEAVSIGTFEATGRLRLHYGDALVGDVSMAFLHDGIPRRRLSAVWQPPDAPPWQPPADENLGDTLLRLLAHPNIRSKEDLIRRYDHEVQGGTAVKPLTGVDNHGPSDAAVIVPALTPGPSPVERERGATRAASWAWDPAQPAAASLEKRFAGPATRRIDPESYLGRIMTEIARRLRREATHSEAILWRALRNRKLDGHKFRRQFPIGAFALDFYCPEAGLAVEIDGPIHAEQQEADRQRQEILESLGIRFIRFPAAAVENDLPGVLTQIRAALTPSPAPRERGSGGEGARAVALANGVCPAYGELDPYAMAWAAVDEALRNLVAVGADPDQAALLDNFCWGNANLPDRLGALVRCAQGCYDAAVAFNAPYVSGKDSLNNEYLGADGQRRAIPGTLVISAVGIVPAVGGAVTMDLKAPGDALYLVGATRAELGGSHYNLLHGIGGGAVPQPVSGALLTMRALHQAMRAGLVRACHDLSEGGLAVALAEMCLAGRLGAAVASPLSVEALFSESLTRFVVEVRPDDRAAFERALQAAGVPCQLLGAVSADDRLRIPCADQNIDLPISALERAWRGERPAQQPAALPPAPVLQPFDRAPAVHAQPPRVLILHAAGTNRDHDAALACELAGGAPEIVHVNQLLSGERRFSDYHMLVLPGGFSYGDDLGAGTLWALDLRRRFDDALRRFIAQGRPALGICNGFQALVKAGLLPGAAFTPQPPAGVRVVTLARNARAHFECRWVYLLPNPASPSLFTRGLTEPIYCPVAHGEGRVAFTDDAARAALWRGGLAALTYADAAGAPAGYPGAPNGSDLNIAALCSPAGNVLGLMPHPENHVFPWQHPRWARGERGMSGLRLFENGIRYA